MDMRIIKYMTLMSKLSTIEGRKESFTGQYNLAAKLYRRGELNEDEFMQRSNIYKQEIKSLDQMRRSALKAYAMAA